ncbi:MAG: xanthine dehydrogenase [Sulfobacillus benefaciens]|uniref:Xanthine dehydrogenase n=1 Tax=Sulfobacillus benefaciens TaxID=453960 RepID=A0A2T2X931_9FIRM|nr:MAG: xanthine dehydrogenase [Sulfobacillus benefaciens]
MRMWPLSTYPRYAPDWLDLHPEALIGGILEAPAAPARCAIDNLEELRGLPGVETILTASEVPCYPFTTAGQPEPEPSPYDTLILNPLSRYPGEPVALMAASSLDALYHIRQRAKITYEPWYGPLHDQHPNNVAEAVHYSSGPAAPSEADSERFKTTIHVGRVSHMQLEPHAAMCSFDEENRLVIITTTQVPYHVRRIVARALNCPVSRILVKATDVGGGFGGKQEVIVEPWVAILAVKTGKPVKMMLSRRQEFILTRTRHAATLTVESQWHGRQIREIAMSADVETGPYASHGSTVAHNMGLKSLPLYRAEAYHFNASVRYTPGPVAGAMRGYGGPQGAMAVETHLNQVAARKGLSPWCLRHKVLAQTGDALDIFTAASSFKRIHHTNLRNLLSRTRDAIGEGSPMATGEGIGLAMSMQASGVPGSELAEVSIGVDEDGSLFVKTGAIDIGQGARETLSNIIYDALQLPRGHVPISFSMGQTQDFGFDYGTYASSTTYVSGLAAYKAAGIVRRKMESLARSMMRHSELKDTPLSECWTALAHSSFYGPRRHPVMGHAVARPSDSPAPYAIAAVRLTVHDNGELVIHHIVIGVDAGKPINPRGFRGQIEGAVIQGLGYALWEELELDHSDTHVLNPSLFDYALPAPQDIPPLDIIMAQTEDPTTPLGAKSVGEVALAPIAPAIVGAIFRARGIWMRTLPITREKLWNALMAQRETVTPS